MSMEMKDMAKPGATRAQPGNEYGFSAAKLDEKHYKDPQYQLDVDGLLLEVSNMHTCSKSLRKTVKRIHEKLQRPREKNEKSKQLKKMKSKYDDDMSTLEDSLSKVYQILEDTETRNEQQRLTRRVSDPTYKTVKRQSARDSDSGFEDTCRTCQSQQLEIFRLDKKIKELEADYKKVVKEKEDALTRLSAIASSKLQDNNPNIADLSDANRPTKIAEMFSELYDNEWTDAYSDIEKKLTDKAKEGDVSVGDTGPEVIAKLLDVLMKVYQTSNSVANEGFLERVQENANPTLKVELPEQLRQQIKGYRKWRAPLVLKDIKQFINDNMKLQLETKSMKAYFDRCVEVCWLSVVQDPPLFIGTPVKHGDEFDNALYKDYTKRGPLVDYIVWPPMFLFKDGPLLGKGVAQGMPTKLVPPGTAYIADQ